MITENMNIANGNPERIAYLKDLIQRNYDDDNWYGRDANYEKRRILTIAAKVELLSYNIIFNQNYHCPA